MWKRIFRNKRQAKQPITLVSGLPRSGTSMMMHMLVAGGMDVVVDNTRQADEDNPQGYYEFEPVKQLKEDASWLDHAQGKAVKVISGLLYDLPPDKQYKIIFMQRRMQEVLDSQRTMLQRRQSSSAKPDDSTMRALFEKHLHTTQAWLETQENMDVLYVHYHDILHRPRAQAQRVRQFLGRDLDVEKMVAVVDQSLYRNRA